MNTSVITLSLMVISLLSCKQETRTLPVAPSHVIKINKINNNFSSRFQVIPYGDFHAVYTMHLRSKNGGC